MPMRFPLLLNNLVVLATAGTNLAGVYAGAPAVSFSGPDAAGAAAALGDAGAREIPVIFYYAPTDEEYDIDTDAGLIADANLLAMRKAQLATLLYGVIYAYDAGVYQVAIDGGLTGADLTPLPGMDGGEQVYPSRLLKGALVPPSAEYSGGGNTAQADFAALTMVSASLFNRHIALLRGDVERDLKPSATQSGMFSLGALGRFFKGVWTGALNLDAKSSVLTGWKGAGDGGTFEMPPETAGKEIAAGRKRLAALGENTSLPPLIAAVLSEELNLPAEAADISNPENGSVISILSRTEGNEGETLIFSRSWKMLAAAFNLRDDGDEIQAEPSETGDDVVGSWGNPNPAPLPEGGTIRKFTEFGYLLRIPANNPPSRKNILDGANVYARARFARFGGDAVSRGSVAAEIVAAGLAYVERAQVEKLQVGRYAGGRVIAGDELPGQLRRIERQKPDGTQHNAANGFRKGDIVVVGRVLWECTAAEEDEDGEWRRMNPDFDESGILWTGSEEAGEQELDENQKFSDWRQLAFVGDITEASGGVTPNVVVDSAAFADLGAFLVSGSGSGSGELFINHITDTTFSLAKKLGAGPLTAIRGYGRIADPVPEA